MAIGYRYKAHRRLQKGPPHRTEIAGGVSRLIFGEAPKDLVFLCFGSFNHQPMVVSCFYAGDVVSLPESPIKGIGS